MTCEELTRRTEPSRIHFSWYTYLHSEGRQLIYGWFERAWKERNCKNVDSFEPFIFTWIAFNGWAACVTGKDRDIEWITDLMLSEEICANFEKLSTDTESQVCKNANEFKQLWPIFVAQSIRRRGVRTPDDFDRKAIIDHYLSEGITHFQPRCWKRHQDEGDEIPLDWPHTLASLYRVRNNLFHGEKAAHSEMDQLIVSSAFRVLIHFIHEAGYLTRNY